MLDEQSLAAAEETCRAAGYKTRRAPLRAFRSGMPDDALCLLVGVPNGSFIRWTEITSDYIVKAIPVVGIAKAVALGDYKGLLYKNTCEIEVGLRPLEPFPADLISLRNQFKELAANDADDGRRGDRFEESWVLPLAASAGQKWSAEISPYSQQFRLFYYVHEPVSLKIRGAAASSRHNEALKLLEDIGRAILFELDLRYGIAVQMSRISWQSKSFRRTDRKHRGQIEVHAISLPRKKTDPGAPSLPTHTYPADPLALHSHARSAAGMPLIQFLAYYQILEYYFPDRRNGESYRAEKEQLRQVIRECIDGITLRDYLTGDSGGDFFTGSRPIDGVPRISLDQASADLRDQVADRVYYIRNRIVHVKSGPRRQSAPPILPFSAESGALMMDIKLVQYLALRLMVSRASELRLPLWPDACFRPWLSSHQVHPGEYRLTSVQLTRSRSAAGELRPVLRFLK
jgi:hypothetical protein